jgi:glucosamine-6-phosphate deaminase
MPVVHIAPESECADRVAEVIADASRGADPVIGPATGRSTAALHARLVDMHREGSFDGGRTKWLMLDEFLGLSADDSRTFRNSLMRDLVGPLGGDADSLIGPDLSLCDPEEITERFRDAVHGTTVDVQVLGIGRNGHIGFNEPGSDIGSRTRSVALAPTTIGDLGAPAWSPGVVPRRAVTRGVADILEARTILLLAFGSKKSAAVHAALEGPQSPECPASLLRDHPDLRFFLDAEAAELL